VWKIEKFTSLPIGTRIFTSLGKLVNSKLVKILVPIKMCLSNW